MFEGPNRREIKGAERDWRPISTSDLMTQIVSEQNKLEDRIAANAQIKDQTPAQKEAFIAENRKIMQRIAELESRMKSSDHPTRN